MSMRSNQLRQSLAAYIHAHNAWVDDPNRPNPDECYWDAITELLNTFDVGGIPDDCRDLMEAVELFRDQIDIFDNRDNPNNQMPAESFWSVREQLEKLVKSESRSTEVKKHRETVAQLVKEGVGYEQIARMWGLVDANGTGKGYLIEEEVAKPGSVITADYIHPDDRQLVAATAESGKKKTGKLETKRTAASNAERPCPETPRELWLQFNGEFQEQAARMLQVPLEQVQGMWATWNDERDQQKNQTAANQANEKLIGVGK